MVVTIDWAVTAFPAVTWNRPTVPSIGVTIERLLRFSLALRNSRAEVSAASCAVLSATVVAALVLANSSVRLSASAASLAASVALS